MAFSSAEFQFSAGGGEAPAEEAPAEGEGESTAQLSWPAVKIVAPK